MPPPPSPSFLSSPLSPLPPCLPPNLLDCSGTCFPPHSLHLPSYNLHTLSDWLGNGCCDEMSYGTSAGYKPDFNCPLYKCDNGDCEVCGTDPMVDERMREAIGEVMGGGECRVTCRDMPMMLDDEVTTCGKVIEGGLLECDTHLCFDCDYAGYCDRTCGYCSKGEGEGGTYGGSDGGALSPSSRPHSWCILLTATICPAQDVTHTLRSNPFLRLAEYAASVKKWAAHYKELYATTTEALPRLFVVENSNAALDELRGLGGDLFDFVSFRDGEKLDGRGKGVAEYRAIRHAVTSGAMSGCEKVVKVTGRYFVPGLVEEIQRLGQQVEVVVQSTASHWSMWEEDGGVVRSEVVGFEKGLVDYLFDSQDEAVGLPMERVLLLRSREIGEEGGGKVERWGKLEIEKTRNAESKVIEFL